MVKIKRTVAPNGPVVTMCQIVLLVSVFTFLALSERMTEAQIQEDRQASDFSVVQSTQILSPSPMEDGALPPGYEGCQKYDKYNTRIMTTIYLPSTCDTVSPTLFGAREGFANAGWGIRGTISAAADYDIKNRYSSSTTQKYFAQILSAYTISTVDVTYDLGRNGFPLGSQFINSFSQFFVGMNLTGNAGSVSQGV